MKKSVLIRAALLCLLAVPAAGQVPAGPQEKMPLDGEVRVGRLDNGMTYYIRHYDNPRQRADFFIAHDVGALQEEDDQNGLAHFLEHMAFNGTKHFPGKGILNYLAANGVRFGYNVNAYTSRDRTVYNVSNVPLVRKGLVLLHRLRTRGDRVGAGRDPRGVAARQRRPFAHGPQVGRGRVRRVEIRPARRDRRHGDRQQLRAADAYRLLP